MTYSTLKLCSGRGAFEATPWPRLQLDLAPIAATLVAKGVPVTDARVMLIIGFARETTLSQDGRVLIKTQDVEEARRIFEELRGVAGLPEITDAPGAAPRVPERLIPP